MGEPVLTVPVDTTPGYKSLDVTAIAHAWHSEHGVWLSGADNAHAELWQTVTIPAGTSPVRLTPWRRTCSRGIRPR